MPKKYPRLTPKEAIDCLKTLGFIFARQKGAHRFYKDQSGHLVNVPMNWDLIDDTGIKSIIRQSGRSREEFYGATKDSARKLGIEFKRN